MVVSAHLGSPDLHGLLLVLTEGLYQGGKKKIPQEQMLMP